MLIDSSTQAVDLLESFFFGGVLGAALAVAAILFFRRHRDVLDSILSPKVPLRKVGTKTLVYRASGTAIAAGASYRPEPEDLIVPLEPRMISPYMPANAISAYGITEARFFSVFYQPDPTNIHTFVRTLREASGDRIDFAKLDLSLTLKCGSRLVLGARPDCADIAAAYGVKFSGFVFPESIQPEPKDERHRVRRILEADYGGVLARQDMIGIVTTDIAAAKRGEHEVLVRHPELNTPEGIQMIVDVLQSFLDRAKSAQ